MEKQGQEDNQAVISTGCCEPFDPELWQEKEVKWDNKIFVKDRVTSFMHIPLNMGSKIAKNMALIEKAGAKIPHQLMLVDENSLWGADIYIEIAKNISDARTEEISGIFLTKVFEGPYQDAGKWAKEMADYVKRKRETLKKLYFFYATCPFCAKAYGKNYVVLFAQVG